MVSSSTPSWTYSLSIWYPLLKVVLLETLSSDENDLIQAYCAYNDVVTYAMQLTSQSLCESEKAQKLLATIEFEVSTIVGPPKGPTTLAFEEKIEVEWLLKKPRVTLACGRSTLHRKGGVFFFGSVSFQSHFKEKNTLLSSHPDIDLALIVHTLYRSW